MTETITDLPENEAELLLPFYVNGTANAGERALVERWLAEDPDAAGHLARVADEQDLTRVDRASLGVPSRRVLDELMARVGERPVRVRADSFVERIWSLLSPRYALAFGAALCLLVVAEAGYILVSEQKPAAGFQTASGENATAAGPTALVAFAPDIPVSSLAARLADLGLVIVDGPKPGGLFIVGAPDTPAGHEALAALGATDGLTSFFQLRK